MGTPYSETNDSGGGGELSSLVATLQTQQNQFQASLEQSGKVHKIHYITWSASDITQTSRPNTSYVTSVDIDNAFLKRAGTRLMIQIVVPFSIVGWGADSYAARLYTTISENVNSTSSRAYHYGPEQQLIYNGGGAGSSNPGGGGHRSNGLNEIATMTPSNVDWTDAGAVQLQLRVKHLTTISDPITILPGHFLVTEIFV